MPTEEPNQGGAGQLSRGKHEKELKKKGLPECQEGGKVLSNNVIARRGKSTRYALGSYSDEACRAGTCILRHAKQNSEGRDAIFISTKKKKKRESARLRGKTEQHAH